MASVDTLRELAAAEGWDATLPAILAGRHVLLQDPPTTGMEAHYYLEQIESESRDISRVLAPKLISLWLDAIDVLADSFTSSTATRPSSSSDEAEAKWISVQLIALAGTSSKPALDLLCSGYRHLACGAIRTMFEACLRAEMLRILPAHGPAYIAHVKSGGRGPYQWPSEKDLNASPEGQASAAFRARLRAQMKAANFSAHPSHEGSLVLWRGEESQHWQFGPNVQKAILGNHLEVGTAATMQLMAQIAQLTIGSAEWHERAHKLVDRYCDLVPSSDV